MKENPAKASADIVLAVLLTGVVLMLGYVLLGIVPMLLFALGFVGGLVLWLKSRTQVEWRTFRVPYYVGLGFFVAHKVEEREFDFFPKLSELTGTPMPDTSSPLVWALYASASTWLLVPWLANRRSDFGHFLAWSFFVSIGVIEMAHFFFPLFTGKPYLYFPGMVTAALVAPAGWWGIGRLLDNPPPCTDSSSHVTK